jgi:predicted ATPase
MTTQRISSLAISGYKSIRDAQITFGPINILIGANGAGKSNLASFLELLRQLTAGGLQAFVARQGGANALLHFGAKKTSSIETRVEVETDAGRGAHEVKLVYAIPDRLIIEHETNLALSSTESWSSISTRNTVTNILESQFVHDGAGWPGAGRDAIRLLRDSRIYHFHDTTATSPMRQHGDLGDNRVLRGDAGNLAAVLYQIRQTRLAHYRLIMRTIQMVAPFFQDFSLEPIGATPPTIILRWRQVGADEDFSAHHLSDGTLRFIALATALLQPPEQRPPVMMLDEPELGLHPYAIEVLSSLIRRASTDSQIIVATQAPGLLDHFAPEDVIVVQQKEGVSLFQRLNPPALQEWLKAYSLSELWDKNVLGGRPGR